MQLIIETSFPLTTVGSQEVSIFLLGVGGYAFKTMELEGCDLETASGILCCQVKGCLRQRNQITEKWTKGWSKWGSDSAGGENERVREAG